MKYAIEIFQKSGDQSWAVLDTVEVRTVATVYAEHAYRVSFVPARVTLVAEFDEEKAREGKVVAYFGPEPDQTDWLEFNVEGDFFRVTYDNRQIEVRIVPTKRAGEKRGWRLINFSEWPNFSAIMAASSALVYGRA